MPPLTVIEPSRVWHRKAAIFSGLVLILVIAAGLKVPYVWLLAPFVAYRGIHSLRFLQPGRVGIDLYDDHLVAKYAFRKPRKLAKSEVVRFLSAYQGSTEVVVARVDTFDRKGSANCDLRHSSDITMPSGLMRNPGLVQRLEAWRRGTFSMDSLIPPRAEE